LKYNLPSVDISDEALLGFQSGKSAAVQHIIFRLGQELCALPILNVYEIKRWNEPTPLPNQPDYIEGVVNLRGEIVPIIAHDIRFNILSLDVDEIPESVASEFDEHPQPKVILVMQNQSISETRLMGVVIDAVIDVAPIESHLLQDVPSFGGRIDEKYIRGICEIRGNTVLVLSMDELFDVEKMA